MECINRITVEKGFSSLLICFAFNCSRATDVLFLVTSGCILEQDINVISQVCFGPYWENIALVPFSFLFSFFSFSFVLASFGSVHKLVYIYK